MRIPLLFAVSIILLCSGWLAGSASYAEEVGNWPFEIGGNETYRRCLRRKLMERMREGLPSRKKPRTEAPGFSLKVSPFREKGEEPGVEITLPDQAYRYRLFHLPGTKVLKGLLKKNEDKFSSQLATRTIYEATKEYLDRKMIVVKSALRGLFGRFLEIAEEAPEGFEVLSLTGTQKEDWFYQILFLHLPLMDAEAAKFVNERMPFIAINRGRPLPKDYTYRDIHGSAVLAYGVKSIKYGSTKIRLPRKRHALISRMYLDKEIPKELRSYFYFDLIRTLEARQVEELFIEVADPSHLRLYRQRFGFKVWKEIPSPEYGGGKIWIMRAPLRVVKEKFFKTYEIPASYFLLSPEIDGE